MQSDVPTAGSIGVPHLRVVWERAARARAGLSLPDDAAGFAIDDIVLRGVEVDLFETLTYLHDRQPSFAAFEAWILEKNGGAIEPERILRINAAVDGKAVPVDGDEIEDVLTADDLAFWDANGYVVVQNAVPPQQCADAAAAIWEYLDADPGDPETWYRRRNGHSIWVPLLRHPALWANRRAPRVRSAFAQLWGRRDLWVTVDRTGFNPPERPDWRFPGPRLHWDAELVPPVRFDVQGILYLTDTSVDQGAFTCVPGFHRRVDDWLRGLPPGTDPQKHDLDALGAVAIAGRAGDLIIWHNALPHGASPNRTDRPRIVQYIKMQPSPRAATP